MRRRKKISKWEMELVFWGSLLLGGLFLVTLYWAGMIIALVAP